MPDSSSSLIIRLPRSTYFAVAFITVGLAPVAFAGNFDNPNNPTISALTALYLIPLAIAFYIARSMTLVNSAGILVRGLFGHRALLWTQIRGLSVEKRTIYVVLNEGGAIRLPCVRIRDLAAISAASAGRLPEIPEAPVIPAPAARRR